MAVLSDTDRRDAMRAFVRRWYVEANQTADLTTDELQTLVNDLDAWLDSVQANANSAITAAVRNKASAAVKFAALGLVAFRRGGLL